MNRGVTNQVHTNKNSRIFSNALLVTAMFLIASLGSNCASSMETTHREALFDGSKAIIIDHTCTDLSKIPTYWLDKAKELTIYYAHTSHGSQIVSGAEFLAKQNPQYGFAANHTNAQHPCLPVAEYAIRMCHTFGSPATFWESYYQSGGYTRIAGNTGLFNFAMFSWCGQQSSNTEKQVRRYLEALDGYEKEYPEMRFIYMTGHTDGRNRNLRWNNEMVREYCAKHNKVLFDFADIESWSPDGKYYSLADDDCTWCASWCDKHPEDCAELPNNCAHSPNKGGNTQNRYNCVQKAKAFWWMMARLAGWTPDK